MWTVSMFIGALLGTSVTFLGLIIALRRRVKSLERDMAKAFPLWETYREQSEGRLYRSGHGTLVDFGYPGRRG